MIRLALIRQKYRPDGGAEKAINAVITALNEDKKIDVSLISRNWSSAPNNKFKIIKTNPLKWSRVSRERRFKNYAQKLFSKFDLIQSHERIPGCNIYRAGDGVHKTWLCERSKIKKFKPDRFHRYVMAADEDLYAHPNLKTVICNSLMVKEDIKHKFNVDENKLKVIYNSVDSERFNLSLKRKYRALIRKKLNIPANATTMLFVGSGFERKGLDATLKVIAKTDCHLIVLGKDKQQAAYQNTVEKLGLSSRVHFQGVQQTEPYYGAADGLILPTLYDPFPNVILEAMASGLGIITSNTCGAAEFIIHDVNGYVCDALDESAILSALENFASQAKINALGGAARKAVLPYTSTLLHKQLIEVYKPWLK